MAPMADARLSGHIGGILGALETFLEVPQDVDGDGRADASYLVHEASVVQLLLQRGGGAGLAESAKPRARVGIGPAWSLDLVLLYALFGLLDVHTALGELVTEQLVSVLPTITHPKALPRLEIYSGHYALPGPKAQVAGSLSCQMSSRRHSLILVSSRAAPSAISRTPKSPGWGAARSEITPRPAA